MHNTTSVKLKENENEKRYNILHTAKRLFLNQGYRKTTIRQIVKEAGTSTGNFYFYFPELNCSIGDDSIRPDYESGTCRKAVTSW